MKLLLLILTMLLLGATSGTCQDIPKGAEAITVNTSLADSVLFEKAVSAFDAAGFTVNRADTKRGTIVTDNKKTAGLITMRILANVHNGSIILKGQWSGGGMGVSFTNQPVEYKGGANIKKSFVQLNALAEQLKSSSGTASIEYTSPVK